MATIFPEGIDPSRVPLSGDGWVETRTLFRRVVDFAIVAWALLVGFAFAFAFVTICFGAYLVDLICGRAPRPHDVNYRQVQWED